MAIATIIAAAQAAQNREDTMYHRDEWGRTLGHCNSCGEEGLLDDECDSPDCTDGEMVPYNDEEIDS